MSYRAFLVGLCLAMIFPLLDTAPAASEPPALTARQQNLLLQLADAEANIQAINKALKVTGYRVGIAYDHIDSNLKGSEIMDRKGGGPVRWDAFYGKTAKDYGTNHWGDQRPQQFDFVYRANDDQISRARDSIANLAKNQEALLERRQKHEADQSRLWATLAWEQVKDREIALHGTSRFALKPSGPDAAVLRPVILFLRTADRVAVDGLDSVQNDQVTTFQAGSQRMTTAFTTLQVALADALEDPGLKTEHRTQGQALKALCKDLSEQCKVIADNYANALDRDRAKQDTSKLEFRGLLQESLARFAMVVGQLDEQVATTAKDWGVGPDRGTPTSDVVRPEPVVAANLTVPNNSGSHLDSIAVGDNGAASATRDLEKDTPAIESLNWVKLFNGRDLTGWVIDGGGEKNFSVENGVLVTAGTGYATHSYLLSNRDYSNFILRLDFKLAPNSHGGIALRADSGERVPNLGRMPATLFDHPIIKLMSNPRTGREGSEETGTTHWVADSWYTEPTKHARMNVAGDWNHLEVRMRNRSLELVVNGVLISHMTLADNARFANGTIPALNRKEGRIGIQRHTGTMWYRNIEIAELGN